MEAMSNILISAEMWFELKERVDALEKAVLPEKRLGPQPETQEQIAERDGEVERLVESAKAKFEVDRSARVLTDGSPVPEDYSHTEIEPDTGMQKGYIVLTVEERRKGFIRPVRRAYKHLKCGQITTMALSIAETMARDPGFYSDGYCATCKTHFGNEEFVWPEDGTQVGT
jgi:hypothetical protein